MYQNTIAWMIAGGIDEETVEDRRHREQRLALRASTDAAGRSTPHLGSLAALVARWTGRTEPGSRDSTLGCCAA